MFKCKVCGAALIWDCPSGVCSERCLRKAQGFQPAIDGQGDPRVESLQTTEKRQLGTLRTLVREVGLAETLSMISDLCDEAGTADWLTISLRVEEVAETARKLGL